MKKLLSLSAIVVLSILFSGLRAQTINGLCDDAMHFCTGITYNYPAGVNSGQGETGPNYGCLYSQPNPAWYYLRVEQAGDFSLHITSVPSYDVDFACWGPFSHPTLPCTAQLTAGSTTPTHHASGPSTDYPTLNMVDCSYDASYEEWCYIPNAQAGDYYLIMITNYSNQPCNIIFEQINIGQPNAGVSDCTPVGTITGTIFLDNNGNGIQDTLESGIAGSFAGTSGCGYFASTDIHGDFYSYVCTTPDTITPWLSNPYLVAMPPFQVVDSLTPHIDFAVTPVPNVHDLRVTMTNVTVPRPGFDCEWMLTCQNKGTVTQDANVKMIIDTTFSFISANPVPDSLSGDTLMWDLPGMTMFETRNIEVVLFVDSTIPLATMVMNSASVIPVLGDSLPSDNFDTVSTAVVGSLDPNDKQVVPSGNLANDDVAAGQELVYTVRFQNTGTWAALNIRVVDSLSQWLSIPTFEMLSSSFPCTWSINENNVLEVKFNNINLPYSSADELNSHGFFKFSIHCKPALADGGDVYNKALIYFDSNPAIITNTTHNYVEGLVSVPNVKDKAPRNIFIQPNPASGLVTISFKNPDHDLVLELLDPQGRVVLTQSVPANDTRTVINVSSLEKGVYIVRLKGSATNETTQLVVE
jgi:uncharacterized repeat protein (TIGR01451 family)